MNEILHEATVSVALVRIIQKHLARSGVNSSEFCKAAGMDPSILENTEARISMGRFHSIWRRAERMSGGGSFGPRIGKEIAGSYFGGNILFSIMMNCPAVGDAMDKFFRYHDLMEDAVQPKMRLAKGLAYLSWEPYNPALEIPRPFSEALLVAYIHILRHITENGLNLVETRFTHPRPDDVEEYKRIFQSPLLFEQPKNELVIEKSFLETPIFLANPGLLDALESFAEKLLDGLQSPDVWSDKVTRLIGHLLIGGKKVSIDIIAGKLALSARVLQTKLKKEGGAYQKLLDRVRKEIALNYLQKPDVTICDITFLLGFSEQSAFNHAFKKWTGLTPRMFRRSREV